MPPQQGFCYASLSEKNDATISLWMKGGGERPEKTGKKELAMDADFHYKKPTI
jgi:hypothetical protein